MLKRLLAFECRFHIFRPSFAVGAVIFTLLGFGLSASKFGAFNININAPYAITMSLALLSLCSMFPVMVFAANAVLRDRDFQMEGIVFATPVPKAVFLGSRTGGIIFATSLLFLAATIGLIMGTYLPNHDPQLIGSFNALNYLHPLALFVLPNLVLITVVLVGVAILTRSMAATYFAGLALYVFYLISASFSNSPLMATSISPSAESAALAAMIDPIGLSAFFEQCSQWGFELKETSRVALEGRFLINRVAWVLITGLLTALVYKSFSFRSPAAPKKQKAVRNEPMVSATAYYPVAQSVGGPRVWLRQWLRTVRVETRSIVLSRPFLAAWAILVIALGFNLYFGLAMGPGGTPILPITSYLVRIIGGIMPQFTTLVLVYFGAELVWRERSSGMHSILDTTHAPNGVFHGAKSAALCLVILIMISTSVFMAVVFQIAKGNPSVEWVLHASLFYTAGVPLVLTAVLAVVIPVLVPSRYGGMAVSGLVVLGQQKLLVNVLDVQHLALQYGATPRVRYSDMNGFGHFLTAFNWYAAYWIVFAGLLLLVVHLLWRRGEDSAMRQRVKTALSPQFRSVRIAGAAGMVVWLGLGAWIFYNTNVLNTFETDKETWELQSDYEKQFKNVETLPMPKVTSVKADVALFPKQRRYTIDGQYILTNKTDLPIDVVWVSVPGRVNRRDMTLAGLTRAEAHEDMGFYRFDLEEAMVPGAQLSLDFQFSVENPGFVNHGSDIGIVENGTLIRSYDAFPSIGYQHKLELESTEQRRKYGLPELEGLPSLKDEDALLVNSLRADSDWIDFETVVSTSQDQIAVAPGYLQKKWSEDGRNYFHYKMDHPVKNFFAYVSARYEHVQEDHNGISLEIFHHPEHGENVPEMMAAMKASLDYFGANFSPYQHRQLRILEFPGYRNFAQAYPNTVSFSETMGFIADQRDDRDIKQMAAFTAHEIAHQWWGHQVSPAAVEGNTLITETLADYSSLLIMEKMYGADMVRRMLNERSEGYLKGRTYDAAGERPLYKMHDQPYLHYEKGSLSMYRLRQIIGEKAVSRALASLLDSFAMKDGPYPTSEDLLTRLYAETPEEYHRVIDDSFKNMVFWNAEVTDATVTPTKDGRYRVEVGLGLEKFALDKRGGEESIAVFEELEVTLYGKPPGLSDHDEILTQVVIMNEAQQTVAFTVDRLPSHVMVDPNIRLIDKNRFDNISDVTAVDGAEI